MELQKGQKIVRTKKKWMIIMRLLCHKNEKYKIEEQNDKKAWKWVCLAENETRS